MTDPFVAALDAMFVAPGSAAAAIQPPDALAFAIRVIPSRPDEVFRYQGSATVQGTNAFMIRLSEVPEIKGKTILALGGEVVDGAIVGGELFDLIGDAMLDVEGLTWTIGGKPYR